MATIRVGLPNIDIVFKQKAVTAVLRSERGILAVLVQDDKQTEGVNRFTYKRGTDVSDKDYSDANYKAIKRAFDVAVNKVHVFRYASTVELKDVFKEVEKVRINYICTNVKANQQELANYVRQYNNDNQGHKIVGVVSNIETADSKYIINLKGTGGTLKDDTAVTAEDYVIRIASTLANLPMNRSLTYYVFSDLKAWDDSYIDSENPIGIWITKGFLTLINDDDEVKCGRAVNSLVTFTSTDTETMSHIIIVESMNLILEDIYDTFKNYYCGRYKNSLSNQRLFISAVNSYFRTLQGEEILDDAYDNHAEIDIETQRNAWTSIGKTEAEDWTDLKVQQMSFRTNMYLAGDVKITDALEDCNFVISMA